MTAYGVYSTRHDYDTFRWDKIKCLVTESFISLAIKIEYKRERKNHVLKFIFLYFYDHQEFRISRTKSIASEWYGGERLRSIVCCKYRNSLSGCLYGDNQRTCSVRDSPRLLLNWDFYTLHLQTYTGNVLLNSLASYSCCSWWSLGFSRVLCAFVFVYGSKVHISNRRFPISKCIYPILLWINW